MSGAPERAWPSEGQERIFSRELDATEAGALEQVAAGTTFGALCEQIAGELGEARAPAQAAQWLQGWVEDELLAREQRE